MSEQNKIHKMKTLKINKLILLLIGLVVFNSCVEDDDFDTPNTSIVEPELELPVISVDDLISSYHQALLGEIDDLGLDINSNFDQTAIRAVKEEFVFSLENQNNYVQGYVVSNDEAGNFFEELIIQNQANQGTSGIRVMIDVNPLFVRYSFGQLIYVKLNSLHIGISNGVLTLGIGENLDKIPNPSEGDFIARSPQIEEIVATDLTFSEINSVPNNFQDEITSEGFRNVFIKLNNVQFNRNLVINNNITYAGEAEDEFDGERLLESCDESGSSIIFSTSTFADFKSLSLPAGQGSIEGILTRNFFGEVFNLVINTPEDVNFGGLENRCDPDFLECTGPSGGGSAIFSENFEGFAGYAAEGWTNVNVSGGSTTWITGSFSGSTYAQISGFNSGADEIDVWLVTPGINMDNTDGEEISFDIQTNFDNGEILSVLVSTDFTGDPLTATWEILDANIPSGPASGFGTFTGVGPINVSCVDGTAYFAFLYEGSDPSATTRYHVDNIVVTGN